MPRELVTVPWMHFIRKIYTSNFEGSKIDIKQSERKQDDKNIMHPNAIQTNNDYIHMQKFLINGKYLIEARLIKEV